MSTPPSGFPLPDAPPPGNYYGAPPPRGSNNSGCFKALGISCGVLILLGIIGVIAAIHYGGNTIQQGMQIARTEQKGLLIQRAIVAYDQKHKSYPANLTQLVQDGEIPDPAVLNVPPDPPGVISWRYLRPPQGAPGYTPILEHPFVMTFAGQTVPQVIIINLNGASSTVQQSPTAPPTTKSLLVQ